MEREREGKGKRLWCNPVIFNVCIWIEMSKFAIFLSSPIPKFLTFELPDVSSITLLFTQKSYFWNL